MQRAVGVEVESGERVRGTRVTARSSSLQRLVLVGLFSGGMGLFSGCIRLFIVSAVFTCLPVLQ